MITLMDNCDAQDSESYDATELENFDAKEEDFDVSEAPAHEARHSPQPVMKVDELNSQQPSKEPARTPTPDYMVSLTPLFKRITSQYSPYVVFGQCSHGCVFYSATGDIHSCLPPLIPCVSPHVADCQSTEEVFQSTEEVSQSTEEVFPDRPTASAAQETSAVNFPRPYVQANYVSTLNFFCFVWTYVCCFAGSDVHAYPVYVRALVGGNSPPIRSFVTGST